MRGPFRARYGAADNKHTLLNFDGEGEPPRVLLGLTDKPVGTYRPGEIWWPSIGFGPVGDWWVLWCTRPDNEATRAGMVISDALLWPIDTIGDVQDLTPYLEEAMGEPFAIPTAQAAETVAQAIVSADQRAPVVPGLQDWPGLMAMFWRRLSGADKKAFSGRVMLSPPQHRSDDQCTLFCTPVDRVAQWPADRLSGKMSLESISRAARWLAGSEDRGIEQIIHALSDQPTLRRMRTIARTAERLGAMRSNPSPEEAISLLRSLILIAPGSEEMMELKAEALAVIAAGVEKAGVRIFQSMANIDDSGLPDLFRVKDGMSRWVAHNMPSQESADVASIVEALAQGRSREWWKQTVQSAITDHLYSSSWSKALFRWLSSSCCRNALSSHWSPERLEASMIVIAETSSALASQDASGMLETCTVFGWSTLHAVIHGRMSTVPDALVRQLSFRGDPLPGLEWLVHQSDARQLVAAAVSINSDVVVRLVAGRTVAEPGLLSAMVAEPKWLPLWGQHVALGGQPWPASVDKDAVCRLLVREVANGDIAPTLLCAIGDDLAPYVLDSPDRAELWKRLPAKLLPSVARVALAKSNAGEVFARPEEPLFGHFISIARQSRLSTGALLLFLGWPGAISESDALRWIAEMHWDRRAADVGKRIGELGWHRVAEELYRASGRDFSALPAATACKHLLPAWKRIYLEYRGKLGSSLGQTDLEVLEERVVTLGATIADDRLKDIWIRAGGDVSRLGLHIYPRDRWRDAVRAARNGALRGGLPSLVEQIIEEYPNNEELRDIRALLASA